MRLLAMSLTCAVALGAAAPVLATPALITGRLSHHQALQPGIAGRPMLPAQVQATPEQVVSPTETPTSTPAPTATATPAPTYTPTATPTPVKIPSARSLLSKTQAAARSANTARFDLHEKLILLFFINGNVRAQGDYSQHPSSLTAHLTGSVSALGKTQKLDEYHRQIGKNAWVKSAATKGRWKTEKPSPSQDVGSIVSPVDTATGKGVKILTLKTAGSQTFQGVAVWHVHGTMQLTVNKTSKPKGTMDFLISQKDFLPYRVAEYVNDQKDGILVDLQENMTRFGEKLSIKAPKVGSTTP
ncbi:MAG TPA: hypothetical protein VF221_11935 [Chloroflexota bacterium]